MPAAAGSKEPRNSWPVARGDRPACPIICRLPAFANCAAISASSGERQIAGVQSPESIRSKGHSDTSPHPLAIEPLAHRVRHSCSSAISVSSTGSLSRLTNRVADLEPSCLFATIMLSLMLVFWLRLACPGWWEVSTVCMR